MRRIDVGMVGRSAARALAAVVLARHRLRRPRWSFVQVVTTLAVVAGLP